MKHLRKALSYSMAGSLGLVVAANLQGCGNQGQQPPPGGFGDSQGTAQDQSFFIVIEQTGTDPATYKVAEKHPTSGPTRAILRTPDGKESFLSEEELKRIAEEEAARVEAGTSRLTQDPGMYSGGMSLGETLLAAAAGSLIGGMLANRLAGNANYQRAQKTYGGGRPTASISQPSRSSKTGQPRSGFFGGSNAGSKSTGTRFGTFGG